MADKITAPGVYAMKGTGRRIACITAYDFPTARLAQAALPDVILVGDSVGNVCLGMESTLGVTLAAMEHHTRAASAGVDSALFVSDLPFGTYQSSPGQAVDSSVALIRAGAEAVKLEGSYVEEVRAIVRAGIPVMGHVGMTPQSVNAFGGHRVQGKTNPAKVIEDARALDDAGVFALVLELIPAELAREITGAVKCPTIGIGAGSHCDGQIQVFHDVLGLSPKVYRHAKVFEDVGASALRGLKAYVEEVRAGDFPTGENSF